MRVLVEGVLDRSIVLFGADADPGPELTWARGVTLLTADDAGSAPPTDGPVAVVGWSDAGLDALAFAARNAHVVDRVALIATPIPGDDRPAPGADLGDDQPASNAAIGADRPAPHVPAKTLLIFGDKDPLTGSRHGTWWQRALPDARLEMRPGGGHDLLVPAWKRVLSHCAPRCRR